MSQRSGAQRRGSKRRLADRRGEVVRVDLSDLYPFLERIGHGLEEVARALRWRNRLDEQRASARETLRRIKELDDSPPEVP